MTTPNRADGQAGGPPRAGRPAVPGPVAVGAGRTRVELQVLRQGRDLVVLITGGEAHVGAVAGCDGRPGRGPAPGESGVVQLPGHREGPLAAEAAAAIARAAGCTCAAVVGIHQDEATPEEIRLIVANVRAGLDCLTAAWPREDCRDAD